MVSIKLRYLVEDRDRHGTIRLYLRIPGQPKIRMREKIGTDEFFGAYEAAVAAAKLRPALPSANTFRGLCVRYFASVQFKALDPSTRRWRQRALDRICETEGDKPSALMERIHVRRLRDQLADAPAVANTRLKALKALFAWAVDEELLLNNPARDVHLIKYVPRPHHTWTVEEVIAFEVRHPIGTQAHLAMTLLRYTAGRCEDAVRLGRQHIRDGRVQFTQAKNEHRKPVFIDIPAHPDLLAAIEACRSGHMTFLVTAYGKPFSVKGFGNKFKDWCKAAGLPQCSTHGLRSALATRLAEVGATPHQIQAWTGHQTLSEVDRYTKAASRSHLANDGLKKLISGDK